MILDKRKLTGVKRSNEKIIAIKLCNKLPSKISLEIKNTSIEKTNYVCPSTLK